MMLLGSIKGAADPGPLLAWPSDAPLGPWPEVVNGPGLGTDEEPAVLPASPAASCPEAEPPGAPPAAVGAFAEAPFLKLDMLLLPEASPGFATLCEEAADDLKAPCAAYAALPAVYW